MAKKVTHFIKLQIPAGAANPAPPVGPALGAAQVNIMQFCQAFNAATSDKKGDIMHLRLRLQDPSRGATDQEGARSQERFRRSSARQGWPAFSGAAHQDRRDQDAGPQRQRHRGCQEDRRGHRALHGRHHRRVAGSKRLASPGVSDNGGNPPTTWEGHAAR